MNRIVVAGTSGSGKTTMARALAERLGTAHVELDRLYWERDWTSAADDVFRDRVVAALATDRWVIDGNYQQVRDLYLPLTDTVVWLDLPLRTCLRRVVARTYRRARSGEELWGTGNRESWRKQLGSDSLIWWVLTTHRRRRREYEARFAEPENAHIRLVRLRSSRAADRWLATVRSEGSSAG